MQISIQEANLPMEVYFTSSVTTSDGVCFGVYFLNLIKAVGKNCEKL